MNTAAFYDELAENYHLIFQDWSRAIERQAAILGPMLEERAGSTALRILDCACGIGTQTLGLAGRGHTLVGADVSESAILRARQEAVLRGLHINFYTADMRGLTDLRETGFDAVVAADNALPHLLSDEDLNEALSASAARLRPGGIFLATIRDYDALLLSQPTFDGPAFYSDEGKTRFVHQVWDWQGERYTAHLYLTRETTSGWSSSHHAVHYRALRRDALSESAARNGFEQMEWLFPEQTRFYQPIFIARRTVPEGDCTTA